MRPTEDAHLQTAGGGPRGVGKAGYICKLALLVFDDNSTSVEADKVGGT